MLRLAIVDDEAPARASLRAALGTLAVPVEVVGEAADIVSAVRLLDEEKPAVVLLDIWLGDGTGFDVLDGTTHKDVRVVFITAFDNYAVRAFRSGALHYLLKPVVRADLQEALERALAEQAAPAVALQRVRQQLADRITITTAEGFHVIDPLDIAHCVSDGNYTRFHLCSGERILASRTLKEFEAQLESHGFMRVHHSHLVNMAEVKMYLHREGGVLLLSTDEEVPIAHRRKQDVVEALGRRTNR